MTSPAPKASDPRANWLLRYIAVQQVYDKQIFKALSDAAEDVGALAKTLGSEKIGERTKKYQAALTRQQIKLVIKDMFKGFVPVIDKGQKAAAAAAAQAALANDAKVLKALFPDPKERVAWQSSFIETAQHGIGAMVTRITESKIPLSKRVYKTSAFSSGLLDRRINSALARGASAKEMAKTVEDLILPDTPGGVSYAAMRLARTEINNAFHVMSIHAAQEFPWTEEVEWHLSKVHVPQGCKCEQYAKRRVFPKDAIPLKPHPHCMCYIVPKTMEWDDFAQQLQGGGFDDFFESKYGMPAA